jgi:hypothetical protein
MMSSIEERTSGAARPRNQVTTSRLGGKLAVAVTRTIAP